MAHTRRPNFTAAEKVAILREALLKREPVSAVCERHRIQPSQFYQWQMQFFENGAAAFGREAACAERGLTRQVESLEARLAEKNGVIADISQEQVRLNESTWGTLTGTGWVP